jgi:tetratricopeptide (TPR) repeat protein
MTDPASAPITFVIPGQRAGAIGATRGVAPSPVPLPGGLRSGVIKESVRVGVNRDAGVIRVDAVPGQDVVVLGIDGGPELILHPETARDLLRAQAGQADRGAGNLGAGEVLVPATLRWPAPPAAQAATRGLAEIVHGIVVKTVDVVSGVVSEKAADVSAMLLAGAVDAQVRAGVYKLNASSLEPLKKNGTLLDRLTPTAGNAPMLVFLHGTFSNTSGAFQKLWLESPSGVRSILQRYADAVYALDHPTLGVSPIANAITLAEALPPDAVLHLVTHSRGGLIAEVLARICARPAVAADEIAAFVPGQQQELERLAGIVRDKRIRVDRIVRVACPARGTLMASKRLDAYLSVFNWTLQLARAPVLPELLDFLGAVAQHRLEAESLPGLEAQVPDSALIRWLHAGSDPIPGELRVVAGDVEGDSLTSWIKTLLSDGFYWTDNDFVVQTRSMYGGARRRAGATFLLDQGGKVSHSAYFAKSRDASKVVEAILENDPAGFKVVGLLSWMGASSTGERAAIEVDDAKARAEKPALLVIPGLGGSRLKIGGELVWPASLSFSSLARLACTPAATGAAATDGLVGNTFDELIAYLSQTHETIAFPYDWRQSLEIEAERLAQTIGAALDARQSNGRPVRILAHSSGGLLVRVMQLVNGAVWDRLMSAPGARVVMLGTPNSGFWTPMQALSGDETFGGLLTAAAPPFGEADVRAAFGTMPGVLQLQAGLQSTEYRLDQLATWATLAERDAAGEQSAQTWHRLPLQQKTYLWGLPTDSVLSAAVSLRKQLDEQAKLISKYAAQLITVAGAGKTTTDGFAGGDRPGSFVYLDLPDSGDGRVTTQSSRLPGISTWEVDCDHASLPEYRDAFPAYLDLLTQGTTGKLPKAAVTRSSLPAVAPRAVPSRPSRVLAAGVPEKEKEILSTSSGVRRWRRGAAGRALRVRVVNGDLTFVRQPLMLGHYHSMRLTGTELVIDGLIGQRMSRALAIGSYPENPGTNQVFVNTTFGDDTTRLPRPEAVIVVGLGEEGKLTASALAQTVRQGVVAWAQRAAEKPGAAALFDIAATIIGSGGKGVPVVQSAQLIADAVREADALLEGASLPRVGELQIIELYHDRASEAWRALQLQSESSPGQFVVADTIATGNGALRRPIESNYRGADYDFISVTPHEGEGRRSLVYSLDTKRARTEVLAQMAQMPLLTELMKVSNALGAPGDIGRTLFNILVPPEIEPFFGGSTEMVVELDPGTAGIPWELLDTDAGARQQAEPWAIRSKLVRKLRTPDFRPQVADATPDDRVLIIGEPLCDPKKYLRLPAARAEAQAVADRLCEGLDAGRVNRLISPDDDEAPGPDALAVLSALYQNPWRIVHIAGHGEPSTRERLGGVVLSPSGPEQIETFLSAIEIKAMRVVPELVFVNCCHIAARERLQLLEPESPFRHHYDRPAFAAGLADELIKVGVRCVVVAGWAVEDQAAGAFAKAFYGALLGRQPSRFIDAVAKARRAARSYGGNTWAAYQCYGDPEWTFVRQVADGQQPRTESSWSRRLSGVASARSLMLALETIAIQAKFNKKADAEEKQRKQDLCNAIGDLEQRLGNAWQHLGEVAEMFGCAWAETGELARAIAWYERAVAANNGGASLRATEQLSNLRVRAAWEKVSGLVGATDLTADVRRRLDAAAGEIEKELQPLKTLCKLQSTMERASLIASAYKRIALVRGTAQDRDKERAAIEKMRAHYELAAKIGREQKLADVLYPLANLLSASIALSAFDPEWPGLDRDAVEALRQALSDKQRDDPDFWGAVGEIELQMFEAVGKGTLAGERDKLLGDFQTLGQRVPAAKMWKSVYDNATFVLNLYTRRLAEFKQPRGNADAAQAVLDLLRRLSDGEPPASPAAGAAAAAVK